MRITLPAFSFKHGLGDCSNFAHSIPLYTKRGHEIKVACTEDKQAMFRAAGATIVEAAPHDHPWLHSPLPGKAKTFDHWSGNKSAFNLSLHPLPQIGTYVDLWEEYLAVRVELPVDEQERGFVDHYIRDLPRPLIVTHFQGNTGPEDKNICHETQEEILRGLLDLTDGTIINLDWDNRVFKLNNWRVRHLTDDWQKLNLPQLHCLLSRADLLIAVDSGVLHFSRFARCPTIGLWNGHEPSHYVLPRDELINIVPESHNGLSRFRRLAYQIVECSGRCVSGDVVASVGANLIASSAKKVMLTSLIEKLRTFTSGMTSFVDRHKTFPRFLAHLNNKVSPVVVETGCMRSEEDWTAGMSTYIFGYYLQNHGKLHSVDLDRTHLDFAKTWCGSLPVEFHLSHSHDWFKNYKGPKLDAVYLDSADVGTDQYQECCLIEAKLALMHLAEDGVILIDDTCWSSGHFQGKGGLAVPHLLDRGFRIETAGYQVLLWRG